MKFILNLIWILVKNLIGAFFMIFLFTLIMLGIGLTYFVMTCMMTYHPIWTLLYVMGVFILLGIKDFLDNPA